MKNILFFLFLICCSAVHGQVNNVSPNSITITVGADAMEFPYYRNSPLSTVSPKYKSRTDHSRHQPQRGRLLQYRGIGSRHQPE